jgi:hypothetical protein
VIFAQILIGIKLFLGNFKATVAVVPNSKTMEENETC